MPCLTFRDGHETTRVRHTSWRGGRVAARGARAAGRAYAPHRITPARNKRGRSGISGPNWGVPARAGAIGLDCRAQRAARISLGRGLIFCRIFLVMKALVLADL